MLLPRAALGLARLPLTAAAAPIRIAAGFAGGIADAARQVAADLVDDAEETVESIEGRLEDVVGEGVGLIEGAVEEGVDLIEDGLGLHRRLWCDLREDEPEEPAHAQIEVRGLCEPENRSLRSRLKAALEQVEGVRWAEVNAITNRVAVAFDGGQGPLAGIVSVIEGLEEAHGVARLRLGGERAGWDLPDRADHPSDLEPVHRTTAAIAGNVAALGWSALARAARLPRVPIELTGIIGVLDNNVWLRTQVERAIGRRATDLVLPLANALANGVSQGPAGVSVDLLHHANVLGELRARRRVWEQREPEFYARHSPDPIEPPEVPPRPVPMPAGPVEEWSSRVALAGLAGFGVGVVVTRDLRRSADAFLASVPKAARLGREGFAAQLGRTLAARGAVPLDGSALRRLDRVDTVVLDSDVLVTEDSETGATTLAPGAEEVVEAVRAAGHDLVVAGDRGDAAARVQADATIPRGKAMGEAIRDLQAEGRVVLCVGQRGKRGLAAADVAVGLTRPTGRPPWGADLLLGRSLADAAFVVDATAVAAEVSRRSARFAMAGSGLGALVALTGPRRGAGSRGLLMVNGAAGAALLSGVWSAIELAHRSRVVLPDRTPWHALTTADTLDRLDSGPSGLSPEVARQRRRASRPDDPEVGIAEPFLAELANPLNPVLGVGAGLSAAIGSTVDAALVLSLVGINTALGGVQRLMADRAVAGLLSDSAGPVTVVRAGHEVIVAEDHLVRGDVVVLGAGDTVPADCRLLEATDLEVDESTLTGESLPVTKSREPTPGAAVGDRTSMLYEDTAIAAGRAKAVVVATGAQTELARSLATAGPPPETGVEVRLRELTSRILPASAAIAGGVAVTGLLRRWPLREVAGTGISLAVASVPEGLPFVASAAQIAAARRLAQRAAVVRNPKTVEALGRVGVLCFDKTGTLTEGRMQLRRVSDGVDVVSPEADGAGPTVRTLAAALRASPPDDDTGNQTDDAIHAAAGQIGIGTDADLDSWERVAELPFEANRGVHAVIGRCADGQRLSVKGAPEVVLAQCTGWRRDGGVVALDRAALAQLEEHVEELATGGHRVLAVAERVASERTEIDQDRIERLELVGLLAFADPVRATASAAVAGVIEAGIRPVMVTGDHPSTATAIARELGIANGAGRVLTGAELEGLDDDELDARIDEIGVFARVAPRDKVRLVQAFQRRGLAVAMTGDGANDAAAIRLADVGVALGTRATGAARDAADVVVTDDRIETIVDAIIEGRALWGSVREALSVLVGGNLGEIGFTAVASLLSRRAPMSARQFLLVNLLTDLAPALAIAIRPPDRSPEALLREGPEASLGSALRRDIGIRAAATATGALAGWGAARLTGSGARASTVGLVALVSGQLGQTMVAGGARQPWVLATGLGSAALMAGIVQTPGLSHFFGCRPLGPLDWAQGIGAGALATAGATVVQQRLAGGR